MLVLGFGQVGLPQGCPVARPRPSGASCGPACPPLPETRPTPWGLERAHRVPAVRLVPQGGRAGRLGGPPKAIPVPMPVLAGPLRAGL